ncbi:Alpha-mannosidase 2 [Lamellibrachia satsuma]|nr:Alpha-mannosidase 2 [Lamellibrachia satsuma]
MKFSYRLVGLMVFAVGACLTFMWWAKVHGKTFVGTRVREAARERQMGMATTAATRMSVTAGYPVTTRGRGREAARERLIPMTQPMRTSVATRKATGTVRQKLPVIKHPHIDLRTQVKTSEFGFKFVAPRMKTVHQTIQSHKTSHRVSHGQFEDVASHRENAQHKHQCESSFDLAEANVSTFKILHDIDYNLKWPPRAKESETVHLRSSEVSHVKTPLTIIVVPHSHNDPGWQKTVGEYFEDQTKHILDNMVEKLLMYPKMTFLWAETVFLSMWWKHLDSPTKESVKRLIKRGQLEVVGGGWVVPDEANPHYFALIDQLIEGHQWLQKELDVKPTNTWSLDPFGYSSTLPYLYKRAGFEHMVVLRVHTDVKEKLVSKKALEFFWRQQWDKQGRTDIFTQMMPYKLYNIKHTCGPNQKVCLEFDFRKIEGEISEATSERIHSMNVDRKAKLLLSQYQKKANLFKHNVVLIPLGDDFRYDRSIEWDQQFHNYMMLFDYMNKKKEWNVHARFGTLKDYFEEVEKVTTTTSKSDIFPSLIGDFFPYTDENNEYWTGYFTTRPYDKYSGRVLQMFLRAAELLHTLAAGKALLQDLYYPAFRHNTYSLSVGRQSLGLFQHHDAVTGTSRYYVAENYESSLKTGLQEAHKVINNAVRFLLGLWTRQPQTMSITIDSVRDRILYPQKKVQRVRKKGLNVVIFNALTMSRQEVISLVIDCDSVEVLDAEDQPIVSQINPVWLTKSHISQMQFELIFITGHLSALSLQTYRIRYVEKPQLNHAAYIKSNVDDINPAQNSRFNIRPYMGVVIMLENEHYRATFQVNSGYLASLTAKTSHFRMPVNIQLLMYKSRGSGAYIFQPTGPAVDTELGSPTVHVIVGPVVSEIHVIQSVVEHRVRLVNTSGLCGAALHIDNVVDMSVVDNKELIMRVTSPMIENGGLFYTDLNGFQMVKRERFHNLPLEANYYPMTSVAYIEDRMTRLSLIGAQSLGVASLEKGSLEVMLDRRLLYDDGRGLGEGIQDNKRSLSQFYLLLESRTNTEDLPKNTVPLPSYLAHMLTQQLQQPALVFSLHQNVSLPQPPTKYEPMLHPLPDDVVLVNLRACAGGGYHKLPQAALILHRVAYDCRFSKRRPLSPGGSVNLSTFRHLRPRLITHTSLSLMRDIENVTLNQPVVQLDAMEIYTFKLTF